MLKKIITLSILCASFQAQAQNVGIGTSAPSQKLHVQDNVNGQVGLLVENRSTGVDNKATIQINSENGQVGAVFKTFGLNYPTTYLAGNSILANGITINNNRLLLGGSNGLEIHSRGNEFLNANSRVALFGLTALDRQIVFDNYDNTKDSSGQVTPLNFLYTDANGKLLSSSISAITTAAMDQDWYEVGTTTSPNDINDNIYTQGNVGIGLTNPNRNLHVRSSLFYGAIIEGTSAVSGLAFDNSTKTTSTSAIRSNGNDLELVQDATPRLHIQGDGANIGFVGIGTTAPNRRLDVNGSIFVSGAALPDLPNAEVLFEYARVYPNYTMPGAADGAFRILHNNDEYGTNGNGIVFELMDGNQLYGDGGMVFRARGAAANDTLDMLSLRSSNGYVGMGIKIPTYNAHVRSTNSLGSRLMIEGNGLGFTNAAVILQANESVNGRATGMYMNDVQGQNEWFSGRPYSGSDRFVVQRLAGIAAHSDVAAAIVDGSGSPTATDRFFTIENNGYTGINVNNPDMRLSVREDGASNYIARFHSTGATTDPYQGVRLGTTEGAGSVYADFAVSRARDLFGISVGTSSTDLTLNTQNDAFMDFVITRPGNVGIGTVSPTDKLHVNGNVRIGLVQPANTGVLPSEGNRLYFSGGGAGATFNTENSDGIFFVRNNSASDQSQLRLYIGDNAQAQDAFTLGYNTATGFQEAIRLQTDGNALKPGGGTWATLSDRRTKKEIKPFEDGLAVLTQINPVTFKYNGAYNTIDDNQSHVGIIAQEVQPVAPYMIGKQQTTTENEAAELLNYDGGTYMIYILVNAVKEQQKMIEEHQKEKESLLNRLEKLEKRLDDLEK
jgi:hypothetical protein